MSLLILCKGIGGLEAKVARSPVPRGPSGPRAGFVLVLQLGYGFYGGFARALGPSSWFVLVLRLGYGIYIVLGGSPLK